MAVVVRSFLIAVFLLQAAYANEETCFGSVDQALQAIKDLQDQVLCANETDLSKCNDLIGLGSVGVATTGFVGAGVAKQLGAVECGKSSLNSRLNSQNFVQWFLKQVIVNSAYAKAPTSCRLPMRDMRSIAKNYADDALKAMESDLEKLEKEYAEVKNNISKKQKFSNSAFVKSQADEPIVRLIERDIKMYSGGSKVQEGRLRDAISRYREAYGKFLNSFSSESQKAMEQAWREIQNEVHAKHQKHINAVLKQSHDKQIKRAKNILRKIAETEKALSERLDNLQREIKRVRGERAIFKEAARDLAKTMGSQNTLAAAHARGINKLRYYKPLYPLSGELKAQFEGSRIRMEHEIAKLDTAEEIKRQKGIAKLSVQESLKASKVTTTRSRLHAFKGGARTLATNLGKNALISGVSLVALGPGLVLADGGLGCYDGYESHYASFDEECNPIETITNKDLEFLSEPQGIQVQELIEHNNYCESLKYKQEGIGPSRWLLHCEGDGFVLTDRKKYDHRIVAGVYKGDYKIKESTMGGKTWRSTVLYENDSWKSKDGLILSSLQEASACCKGLGGISSSKCELYKASSSHLKKLKSQGSK